MSALTMTASLVVGTVLGMDHLDVNAWHTAFPLMIATHICPPANHQCLKCGRSRRLKSHRLQGNNTLRGSSQGLLGWVAALSPLRSAGMEECDYALQQD